MVAGSVQIAGDSCVHPALAMGWTGHFICSSKSVCLHCRQPHLEHMKYIIAATHPDAHHDDLYSSRDTTAGRERELGRVASRSGSPSTDAPKLRSKHGCDDTFSLEKLHCSNWY